MALRLAARQARLVVFGYNAVTSKIEWVRSPDSPQYAGSPLSLNGGQVMAYYKDGTASDITGSCVYNPDAGTLLEYGGELNINATYTDHAGNEFTADTKIDVADVEELLFTGLANPTQKEGAALDLSGAVLSARYSDGTVRTVDASAAVFSPAGGTLIGHMDTLSIQAMWRNPATGSEYYAEYTLNVDAVDGIYFSHSPNKVHYAEGEPLDLVNVDDLNDNADIIDAQLKANADGVAAVRESIPRAVEDAIAGNREFEKKENRVTAVSTSSTDAQYPTAKAVWTLFHSIVDGNGVSY